jgi:hypothetical protein
VVKFSFRVRPLVKRGFDRGSNLRAGLHGSDDPFNPAAEAAAAAEAVGADFSM